MSNEVTLRWNGERFIRAAQIAAERALAMGCEEVRAQMKVNLSGPSPSSPGSYPGADTGRLSREIFNRSIGTMTRAVGSDLKYGRYLEYGAIITPKKVKYLPVPLNKAARRMLSRLGGSSLRTQNLALIIRRQRSAKALIGRAGTAQGRKTGRGTKRRYLGRQLSLFRPSGNEVLLLLTKTPGGKISKSKEAPAFILKKRVVLAARPWCYRTALQTRDQFFKRFEYEMKQGLAAAASGGAT